MRRQCAVTGNNGRRRAILLMKMFVNWINDSLARIEPYLHSGFWPPIWWRLAHVDFDWLVRSMRRVDSDGYFRSGDGFVLERDAIMAWVDRIDEMLQRRSG